MKNSIYLLLIIIPVLFVSCESIKKNTQKEDKQKPNILFIAVDDLRPELGCYGQEVVQSPNIDKLASEGFLFKNHYVAVPTCGASRYSLITGMLPKERAHIRNSAIAEFMSEKPETERPESFIHHLRRSGYYTVGIGKISHMPDGFVYGYQEPRSEIREMPHSWDEFHFNADKWGTGHNAFFGYADGTNRNDLNKQVKPYEAADVEDEGYPDGLTAKSALQKLKELKEGEKPFFLAVGFFKPHLPFTAPKKYWDLYDQKEIPISPAQDLPENVHTASLHASGEFNQYALGEEKAGLDHNLSDDYTRKVKQGYYACISYIDTQVGKLLTELKNQGLEDNTIVVLWGDHGWHLGDHRVWGKHTVFDRALKSALIMRIPGMKNQGQNIDNVVSTVDLYPTILELSNVEMPHKTDGSSLVSLLQGAEENREDAAYSYFRNGISLKTDKYRLTKYFREQQPLIELFDHQTDPNETKNIAAEHPDLVELLMPLWEKGNSGLYEK